MRTISLEKFRGRRDAEVLDPAAMTFRAVPAKHECRGCAFEGQWTAVCKQAAARALAAGIADCDDGYVYVTGDPRQIDILESGTVPAATGAAPDQ